MDLGEDEAEALFPKSRNEGGMEVVGDFHLGIDFGGRKHVVIYTDDESFALTEDELETMLDELELESVWHAVSHRFKVFEYLRSCDA